MIIKKWRLTTSNKTIVPAFCCLLSLLYSRINALSYERFMSNNFYVVGGCTGTVKIERSNEPIDIDDGPIDVDTGGKGISCARFIYLL